MKKHLLLTFLLITSYNSFAQEQKIEGLGKFKIGITTTAIINEIADEQNTQIKQCSMFKLFKPKVCEANDRVLYFPCPNVREFYIREYNIANIKVFQLELTFFDDKLYEIHLQRNKDIDDVFELKYGKGKKSVEEKEITCINGLNIQSKHIERYLSETWENQNIRASSYSHSSYNDKCEASYRENLLVYDFEVSNVVFKCSEEIKKEKLKSKFQNIKDL